MISPDGNPVLIQFGDGVSQGSGSQAQTQKTQNYARSKETLANIARVEEWGRRRCIAQRYHTCFAPSSPGFDSQHSHEYFS